MVNKEDKKEIKQTTESSQLTAGSIVRMLLRSMKLTVKFLNEKIKVRQVLGQVLRGLKKLVDFIADKFDKFSVGAVLHKGKSTVTSLNEKIKIGYIFGVTLRSIKLIVNFLTVLVCLLGVFGVGIGVGFVVNLFDQVTAPNQQKLLTQVSDVSSVSKLLYSDNSLISEVSSDLLRTPVTSDNISQNIKDAVIATEDVSFESHNGVVPKAVFRAALGSVGLGSSSGGSTVTQQLIKQQLVGDAPTFSRKANEIVSSLALERVMKKDDILTTYLNVSPFGRNNRGLNIAGVEEAAQGIFGKSAKDLSVPQAAFIAGLPQSPIVYSPYSAKGTFKSDENMSYGLARQKVVLYNMYRAGKISQKDYETYKAYDIKQDFVAPSPVMGDNKGYLYYAVMAEAKEIMYHYLLKRDKVSDNDLKNDKTVASYQELAEKELSQGGYTIKSTVDKDVYNAMQSVVTNYGYHLDENNSYVETGSVLLDNKSGAILGFIGGRDYTNNKNNHALSTKRSPGSTVKPFLAYGIAIDQGLMGSASILSNYPATFSDGTQIMHGGSRGTGMMTLQSAINGSANIPAFWTYKMLQNNKVDVKSYMDKMNYDISTYDIESLPLGGGIETTVAENTNAYQTLANGGVYQQKYIVESITTADGKEIYKHQSKPIQVYSKATSSIMMQLLKGPLASGETTSFMSRLSALNPSLVSGGSLVGKTGTSNDTADVWLMLSTPSVTLGTWAGRDDNGEMYYLTGYNNNAQYSAYLVNTLAQAKPEWFASTFKLDSSVISSVVLSATGQKEGTVQLKGSSIVVTGDTTTSYWAKKGAPTTSYDFMIGGIDSDKAQAWSSMVGRSETVEKPSSTKDSSSSSSSQSRSSSSSKDSNTSTQPSQSG